MRGSGSTPDQYFADVREDIRRMTASSLIHMLTQNQRFRLPAGLDRVQAPTLVVAGQHEYRIMRRSARELVAALPHAQGYLVSIGKRLTQEHAWNLWAPDLFNAAARAWIEDRPLPAELVPLR
jgi:pimeloyl-ACP methyl ester carboxylesterase